MKLNVLHFNGQQETQTVQIKNLGPQELQKTEGNDGV